MSDKKIHINKKGMPGKCGARPGNCPLGGEHFDTVLEAAQYLEKENKAAEIPPAIQKPQSFASQVSRALNEVPIDNHIRTEILRRFEDFEPELKALVDAQAELADETLGKGGKAVARMQLRGATTNVVKRTMESIHGTESYPDSVKEKLWDKSYSDGHSGGFNDVENHYMENSDLTKVAYDASRDEAFSKIEEFAQMLETKHWFAKGGKMPGFSVTPQTAKDQKDIVEALRKIIKGQSVG